MILIHPLKVLITLGGESKKLVYFMLLIIKTFAGWMLRYSNLKMFILSLSFSQKDDEHGHLFFKVSRNHHRSHRLSLFDPRPYSQLNCT